MRAGFVFRAQIQRGSERLTHFFEDVPDERAAVVLGQRLILALSEPITLDDGLSVRVGASVGIALGRGGETDVESLLHEADVAVYLAKEAGRTPASRAEIYADLLAVEMICDAIADGDIRALGIRETEMVKVLVDAIDPRGG